MREERRALRAEYRALFDAVSEILCEIDPLALGSDERPREYELEVGTILPRLSTCDCSDDVRLLVHDEFVRWFGRETVGPEPDFEGAAERIWAVWDQRRGQFESG